MRHLDIMEEGGYPFDDISIDYLQKMHNDRDSFIHAVFGDNKIVKGVTYNLQNNTHSDGLITVAGKLYHFVGGAKQSTISKKTIITKRQYEDGVEKKAFINEFYEFGSGGTDVINFSSLKRWYKNEPEFKEIKIVGRNVTNAELSGTGWYLANGDNGTDNLINKFFVVAGQDYNVGSTVGSKAKIISASNLPKVSANVYVGREGTGWPNGSGDDTSAGNPSSYPRITKKINLEDFGANDVPLDITPLSYVVVALQFIGV